MAKQNRCTLLVLALYIVVLSSCQANEGQIGTPAKSTLPVLVESPVREIPLIGSISEARSEISGMAWCGEDLILLPQYPHRFQSEGTDHVFGIPKEAIQAFLSGENQDGIEPETISLDTKAVETLLPGFEGFESILINGDVFYVTVEAREAGEMMGYILTGHVLGSCDALVLYPTSVQQLEPQADVDNMSHETLVYFEDQVYAIYEANGVNVNPSPNAHVFDWQLGMRTEIPMTPIEYRVTDAAQVDEVGEFWAINYFFPGDSSDLKPGVDQVALANGIGRSHREAEPVERLVKFRIGEHGITLVDQATIYLELMDGDSRNWEGLVRLGEGFLLVTDKFPTTILAYVEGVED